MKKNILITIFIIFIIFNIDIVINSTKEASILFFNKIFISLFPFMILGNILYYLDYHIFIKDSFIGKLLSKLFNINEELTIIFIFSMLTSTPNNAIYIKRMLDNKEIDINTSNKILLISYFPSISFVLGTIGILMFKSIKIGLILYLNIILNNILIGIYIRKDKTTYIKNNKVIKDNFINMLKDSIIKSISNLYIVLGSLIIFNIIINIIKKILNTNTIYIIILTGLLEITNSIDIISNIDINLIYKITLISFLLNFNGLSILFQSFSILSNYKINIKRILIIKLVFSIISSILLFSMMILLYH